MRCTMIFETNFFCLTRLSNTSSRCCISCRAQHLQNFTTALSLSVLDHKCTSWHGLIMRRQHCLVQMGPEWILRLAICYAIFTCTFYRKRSQRDSIREPPLALREPGKALSAISAHSTYAAIQTIREPSCRLDGLCS